MDLLITGGTGSFGKAYVTNLLKNNKYKNIYIYSRDEQKQWEMSFLFDDPRINYIIGDIRDKERLVWATKDIDIIVHAAATKIVPTAEMNPIECIRTNIDGANNVIIAARENSVKKVLALSTDKASNPINLYGATKLASDKLFVAQAARYTNEPTKYSIVRYGNVVGSRGSVVPYFNSLPENLPTPITDIRMTRFMIFMKEAVSFVEKTLIDMQGGEIFIPKIPSMKLVDIADAIRPKNQIKVIGIRPGEKLHEQMIGVDDAISTFEYGDHYRILPMINNLYKDDNIIKGGKSVPESFSYTSSNNHHWLSSQDFRKKLEI